MKITVVKAMVNLLIPVLEAARFHCRAQRLRLKVCCVVRAQQISLHLNHTTVSQGRGFLSISQMRKLRSEKYMICPSHRALRPMLSLAWALPTGVFIFSPRLGNSAAGACQAWCGSEPEPVAPQLLAAWLRCSGFGAGHPAGV